MALRILITNDDGLNAAQLPNLIRWARKLGEVTAFVPKFEQSGKSHSFEIRKPFEAKQVALAPDITVWSVDSTPADCVRMAVLGMKMEFDLVISDCTGGLLDIEHGHMSGKFVIDTKKRLEQMGSVNDSTVYVINHFSHNGRAVHAELEAHYNPYGIQVGYDGMKIDF